MTTKSTRPLPPILLKASVPLSAAILLGAFFAASLPAAAQPDAVRPVAEPTFGEIIDVRVINLEVVVTDRKTRVMGLTSDDFQLLVDGKEVPIEYFTEVVGGQATTSAGAQGSIPALAPGESVGTRFLVFIDDSFSVRNQRNRVLRRLEEQLPFLGPDDHMAIAAYDGHEIDLLTTWTNSQRDLERALRQARERRTYGLQRRLYLTSDLSTDAYFYGRTRSPFGFGPYDDFGYAGYGPYGAYRGAVPGSRLYTETSEVVDAATSTLRAFARPPGRKVMLLLSGGWAVSSDTGFRPSVIYGGRGSRDLLRPLTDTANRLGYTLYPVDVKGTASRLAGGAEFGSSRRANYVARLEREREWVEESGLLYLAEETGGRAMLDGASLKALERAVEDTRSYYWLGFTPSWQENDQRHRVEVKVRRKGLKVRSRESFSDLSRQTEVTMLVESSQLFDLPLPGESRELGVAFGEPAKGGFRKVIVPLKLEIPLDRITLLPTAEGFAARLELRVAATDDRGNRADIPVLPVELRADPDGEEIFAEVEIGLKLRRRPHKLLVSLHEPVSGNLMSKRVALSL